MPHRTCKAHMWPTRHLNKFYTIAVLCYSLKGRDGGAWVNVQVSYHYIGESWDQCMDHITGLEWNLGNFY